MHPGVSAGLVFFSAAAADAQTIVVPDNKSLPGIRLPSSDVFTGRYAPVSRPADAPFLAEQSAPNRYAPSGREFGIGPFRASAFDAVPPLPSFEPPKRKYPTSLRLQHDPVMPR